MIMFQFCIATLLILSLNLESNKVKEECLNFIQKPFWFLDWILRFASKIVCDNVSILYSNSFDFKFEAKILKVIKKKKSVWILYRNHFDF